MNTPLTSLAALALATLIAPAAWAQTAGDAKAGEKKIAMCIGCHGIKGYQASFPEVYRVPMISGQSEKYIVNALNAYKKGERKHPTMRGIAETLSDQDIADVAAYYSHHGVTEGATTTAAVPAPSAAVDALLKKGACLSCHGEGFAKPIDPSYPKLAGQFPDYLYVTLKSYKVEGAPDWGRSNAIMGGQAKQFNNAELKAMARYIGSLPSELKTLPQSRFR